MISTISVATDGSEGSEVAEAYAVSLASSLGAGLSAISVVEERFTRGHGEDGLSVTPPDLEPLATYLRSRADAAIERVNQRAVAAGLTCRGETAQGIADDAIVQSGQNVDLVALGRNGQHARFHTGLIGGTANGVIRKTSRSTLLVPSGAQSGGPILLAFDASPGARIGAQIAVRLASSASQEIHVFVDSKDKGRAAARFEEVRDLVASLSVPVREVSSTLGRPDVKFIDSAQEIRAGLIVMGAYGRNRINEYFLGSNAAAVARTSPIAVLLAR